MTPVQPDAYIPHHSDTDTKYRTILSITPYYGSAIYDFLHSEKARLMWDNIDQSNNALFLSPWYIEAVVNASSCLLVASEESNDQSQSEIPTAFFLCTIERNSLFYECRAHRYDLFPEGVDIIFTREANRERIVEGLAQWIKSKNIIVDIDGVTPNATIIEAIDRAMALVKRESSSSGRCVANFPSLNEFLASSSRSFRSSMYRTMKRIEEMQLVYDVIEEYDRKLIDQMFELHSLHFETSSEMIRYKEEYYRLFQLAIENNSVFFTTLFDGDKPVVIDFWFYNSITSYAVNGGRAVDDKYKGVGTYMLIRGIEESFRHSVKRVNLMRPDSNFKRKMGGEPIEYIRLRCARTLYMWILYRFSKELRKLAWWKK